MAHLEVEPKPKRSWWIWVLIVVILVAIGAMLYYKKSGENLDAPQRTTTLNLNLAS